MRVIDLRDGFDQTFDDVQFIEEWELDRDSWQVGFGKPCSRHGHKPPVAPEVNHLLDAIRSVNRQGPENRKVDDQDDPIEGVELVERTEDRKSTRLNSSH